VRGQRQREKALRKLGTWRGSASADGEEKWLRYLVAASAAVVAAVILVCRALGLFQPLELAFYDLAVRWRANESIANVAAVTISDEELNSWGWPLSDERLAQIVAASGQAGANIIGIDIYRDRPVPPASTELSSLLRSLPVVGISKLGPAQEIAIPPPAELREAGRYGFSDVLVDDDGAVRRALLLVSGKDGPALSLAMRIAYLATEPTRAPKLRAAPDDPRTLVFGKGRLPRLMENDGGYAGFDDKGYQLLIDYRSAPWAIPIVSASSLLADPVAGDLLRGRIVLIGTTSEAVKDFFLTPFSAAADKSLIPGVVIHAAIIDQLLRLAHGETQATSTVPDWIEALAIILLAFGGAFIAYYSRTPLRLVAFGPALGMVIAFAATAALLIDWWLPAAALASAWLGSFIIVTGELALIASRRQRMLSRLFSTHMSQALADEVWNNRRLFLAGSRPQPMRLQATVLFADLAGSTRIGGTKEPHEFVIWLGGFLDRLTEVASAAGGFIEKLTGDGIMVVFGAPVPRTTADEHIADATNACDCALEMARSVEQLNQSDSATPPYNVRIGIHSGSVLAGTFGSAARIQYSLIGDAANVAARMQTFGKSITSPPFPSATICISEDTKKLIGNSFETKEAGIFIHDDGTRRIAVFLLTGKPGREDADAKGSAHELAPSPK
jgi:adenylate cyclase